MSITVLLKNAVPTGILCHVWYFPSMENLSLRKIQEISVLDKWFSVSVTKMEGQENFVKLRLVFHEYISWIDEESPVQMTAKVAVVWCLSSMPLTGTIFAPLKLNVHFPVLTKDMGVWYMLMIKHGGIPCLVTNVDMFLWKLNFSSAKNWGEGSSILVAPLRLFHLSFSNTPQAHFSVNTGSLPKSIKSVGLFANYTCCYTYKLMPSNETPSYLCSQGYVLYLL